MYCKFIGEGDYVLDLGSVGAAAAFAFVPLLFFLFMCAVHILICIWAYRDARRRGNSKEFALIVLVALLFFPVVGIIVYLAIRND